ncbi:MAG TPA: RNA polymerase sigma factor [Xanthobacteraceae bacterium]
MPAAQNVEIRMCMTEGDSDEALMAAVAVRDQRALRVLMGRHMQRAIRMAERVTRNAADADEIGQEAFIRVWTHAPSYDPKIARFTTWLYRIIINLAVDRNRRPTNSPIETVAGVSSNDPDPVQIVIAQEEQQLIADALAALSERQRAAIALFHMEGVSGREAASVMNVSEKAFESLLTRARFTLRQAVEKIQQERRRRT